MQSLITTATGILILTAVAYAADDPKPAADFAPSKATAQPAPGAAAEAAKFFDETIARYRKLKTYQDEAELGIEVVAQDKEGGDAGQKRTLATKLKFKAPNLVVIEREDGTIQCDGTKLWQIRPEWKQYTEEAAPKQLDIEELLGSSGAPLGGHPVARWMIVTGNERDEYFPELRKLREVRAETRGGRAGHVLVGDIELSFMGEGAQKSELWFDDADGLLRELRVDLTEKFREQLSAQNADEDDSSRPTKIERAEIYVRLDNVKADADLSADVFAYKPAEGFKKVDEFDESARPGPADLIDKPAPAFSGNDLAGEKLSLDSLKGRVVVLDFWATWCGPCVAAIPHIQRISDKFKDEPVTIIGMNRDGMGADSKVKKFLEKKKITLRQFMDVDGKIARSYNVSGIPSLFLIDKEGIICDAHVGFGGESAADDLAEKIEKLLKGEKIDREAPSKRDRTAEEEEEEEEKGEGNSKTAKLDDIAPERLVADSSLRLKATGVLRPFDVDGDGKNEWLSSNGQKILITSANGRESSSISVASHSDGYIHAYEPVRIGTKLHWLAAAMPMDNRDTKAVTVILCDSEGKRLWSTELELPAKSHTSVRLAVGDLVGNGKPSFAVGLTAFSMSDGTPSGYAHVLDIDGKLLLRRKIRGHGIDTFAIISGEPGQPGHLIISGDRGPRAYTLGPADAAATDPKDPPVPPATEGKAKPAPSGS